jgi:predicted ATPase/class 3 adenylate cyclase
MIRAAMRRDLPSGTVTFLFTDVEGSTRLLHALGAEGYADALAEHRREVREACAAEGGVEVDTQGDAFFFAFPTALGAVAAAEAMTEALAPGPIQVRVGLHTGSPLLADEGYVGDDVHFAARVASSGHGGQVVLSAATVAALGPTNSLLQALSELGEHRLKDIQEAVPLYQLGQGSFPPLKTISNTNLPRPASSFLGRETELAEVLARIEQGARLLTLTGPGGTGKTRLAIEAAATLVPAYKAGVFWVGLASLRDPSLVVETIAQTLGAKDALAEHIQDRELLLLLDNLEQVIDASPELSALLQSCPNLTLLVTSRELLRIAGEVEYAVPPLATQEAVDLFCERSQLDPAAHISELCARLDSLPLAVELAAARTKALSPAQILERLSGRLDVLKGGRDADPRQQTLRATIEWSYELLTPAEQELFARLSVFDGGCTLEAAEEVCHADLDTLQSLVEKSLVRFSAERYWMLETIREFAGERLREADALEGAMDSHADWMLRRAAEVGRTRALDRRVREGFIREQDNFRRALAWAEERGRADLQLGLIGRSWLFWWDRGHSGEGLRWVEAALRGSAGDRSKARADVLAAGAMFAARSGDQERLASHARESLAIARERADPPGEIWPLIFLAIWASQEGDYAASARQNEEAIAIASETGNRELVGIALNNLGVNASLEGNVEQAATFFDRARVISRELGAVEDLALETLNVAECFRVLARVDEAAGVASEGLALAREIESERAILQGLEVVVAIQHARGMEARDIARIFGAAEALRDRLGEAPAQEYEADLESIADRLEATLGHDGYEIALREGRVLPLDAVVDAALASLD